MKLNKKQGQPISVRLWISFAAFAAVIIALLWILQTMLLQGFYDGMQKRQIKQTGKEIANNYGAENFAEFLDIVATDNSILIILADKDGNILYSADEYSYSYKKSAVWHNDGGSNNPYHSSEEMDWQKNAYRILPQNYSDFTEQLKASGEKSICYAADGTNDIQTLIYGEKIDSADGEILLYINTTLGAVGSTVEIIRIQLAVVTAVALILALIMAIFISRSFSKPIKSISVQARKMADGNFDMSFTGGGCRELDELSATFCSTAERLAESDRLKRDLLANVSHDLRTPLTLIKGYAELIRDTSGNGENGDLEVIIREADRLSLLVNDILEYSRLQSGNIKPKLENINLSSFVEEIAESFSAMASDRLKISVNAEPNLLVNADRKMLERVLYNFISNAAAHIGDDNTVYVSVGLKNSRVRTEISDNGEGIDKAALPYVWDKYFTSREKSSEGTGLGLSIVKEILTAHGADFGAESEKGRGSTFWFEFSKA